jgi:hypothetical protein
MKLRNLGLALAACSALTPAISRADKTGFGACVAAFEKTLDAPSGASRTFRVVYRGDDDVTGSIARFYRRISVYDLSASDPNTGSVIARARCTTDSRGMIASLSPLSDEPDSRAAQRPTRMARD